MKAIKFPSLHLMFVLISIIVPIYAGSIDFRKLQSSASFVANYSAGFLYLRDALCLGDPPLIHITCFGNNLTVLGTSDPSILCNELSTPDVENGVTHQCSSNCSGTACEEVYLTSGAVRDGPFASIYFACEGDSVQDVGAYVTYLAGNSGTCAASSSAFATTRNIHVARLGVSCPVGSSREYVYDDTFFDCSSPRVPVEFINAAVSGEDDVYSCGLGLNCDGRQCNVPFYDLLVHADVQAFLSSCVDSTVPITTFPTVAPVSSRFEYSAQFQAVWGRLFDPVASVSTCSSGNSAVVVSCGNGASVSFVNSTDYSMVCTPLNESELSCVGASSAIDNFFTSVIFVRSCH